VTLNKALGGKFNLTKMKTLEFKPIKNFNEQFNASDESNVSNEFRRIRNIDVIKM